VSSGTDEPTQPLGPQPSAPPPTWRPPAPPSPTHYPPPGTRPMPEWPVDRPAMHAAPRARVSGWVWPMVTVLALVLGVVGGIAGSVVHDRITDDPGGPVAESQGPGLESSGIRTGTPLDAEDTSIAAVAAELLPSTVQVVAEYDGDASGATGSGFVLDRSGHVVTNNHVVEQAAENEGPIEVVDQKGNRYDATVVGRSPVYDLAVLEFRTARRLKPAVLGSSRALVVGETVVAIGSPLGLTSTVTAGIVSALERPVTTGGTDESSYINAVQTDAAINPGNSGGPLVNLLGQVVGVNSAIATMGGGIGGEAGNIGVGFAIPIEQVKITADQILRTGEARYPVIGAKVQTGERNGEGALIDEVLDGTPADDSGLRKGDVVVAIEGHRITDGIALIVSIRSHQPGETLVFTVLRDGQERTFEVTLDSEVG
jgi:putative serine protease PepD